MRDIRELRYMQSLPLEQIIIMTEQRIQGWYEHYNGQVYVSLSGGKDSTVLLHIARQLYPSMEAVFVDTGLEYSQIRDFAKSFDNVTVLHPKMRFDEVIRKYGYPLISKEIAQNIYEARKNPDAIVVQKFDADSDYVKKYGQRWCLSKWNPLLHADDIAVSHMCCHVMKKAPIHQYSKESGKYPIVAMMADESNLRRLRWQQFGCNGFEMKYPSSNPMAFWTEQDVLRYIYENDVEICSVYGDVVCDDEQLNFDGEWVTEYHTTGCSRTGCVFCGFGAHIDKGEKQRFLLLKQIDEKKYNYCFSGGEFVNGIWQPNKKGLGMQYVYDRLNELYGDGFVTYK